MTEEIEFVNDWSELEDASAILNEWSMGVEYNRDTLMRAALTVSDYVPRLLTQYANLVELSFALTEGWEQYASLQGPTGLYLPDHR